MQIYEYSLVEVVILVRNLLNHRQILGLDVLAEHGVGRVSRDLHNVIDIHSGKIHQGCARAPCGMRVHQIAFLLPDLLRSTAVRYLNLDFFGYSGIHADFFQVAVDDLVLQMQRLKIILPQNLQQLAGARNCDLGSCFLLLLQESGVVVIAFHIDVIEVIYPMNVLLECRPLIHSSHYGADGGRSVVPSLLSLASSGLNLLDIELDALLESHLFLFGFLLQRASSSMAAASRSSLQ